MMKKSVVIGMAMALAVMGVVAQVRAEVASPMQQPAGKIDRHVLVTRHNVTITEPYFDLPRSQWVPMQVGNGHFAFGFDVTGLQTFMLQGDMSRATLSDWGWYTAPNPENYHPEEMLVEIADLQGRKVPYAYKPVKYWLNLPPEEAKRAEAAWNYFRDNPGRLPLGQIRFRITKSDGKPIAPSDLQNIQQTLDLWSGIVTSRYEIEGTPVEVITSCHPQKDQIAVRVKSRLITEGRLKVSFELALAGVDRESKSEPRGANRVDIAHRLDSTRYFTSTAWSEGVWEEQLPWRPGTPRRYLLTPAKSKDTFEFVSAFAPEALTEVPDASATHAASAKYWPEFWQSGGAIDLSESKDPRWKELERRIVLSQYMTKVNSSGNSPPQESGLFSNSWGGKFHLECAWFHGGHFALWGRPELLDGWMRWYRGPGLESARRMAAQQGYKGAKWMKMIAPTAEWESPSAIGPFRIDQSAMVIHMAELMYHARPTRETLEQLKDVVMQTAEFLVDRLTWDEKTGRYVLGPPLMDTGEITDYRKTLNSTFVLSYWRYGLTTAQVWRQRLGLPPEPKWDEVLSKLAKPTVYEGYLAVAESHPQINGSVGKHKPYWLGAFNIISGSGIEPAAARKTFDAFWERATGPSTLNEDQMWGSDCIYFANVAAELGRTREAIDLLLMDKPANRFLPNGFNNVGSTPYVLANGLLLWTTATMAAGWEGGPDRHAPGFPDDGSWVVKWEGLKKSP